jgi:hypothetical protein
MHRLPIYSEPTSGWQPRAELRRKWVALLAASVVALVALVGPATSAVPRKFHSCAALNRRYPHGVGKLRAHDHTSSGEPVTTFKRSVRLYLLNKGLDRDKDGIACEKS